MTTFGDFDCLSVLVWVIAWGCACPGDLGCGGFAVCFGLYMLSVGCWWTFRLVALVCFDLVVLGLSGVVWGCVDGGLVALVWIWCCCGCALGGGFDYLVLML